MKSKQHGFSLVEVLVVVAIIGILSNIAIPNLMRAHRRAQATSVIGDFLLLRKAVFEYHRDHGVYPRDRNKWKADRELGPYIDDRVDWVRDDLGIEYDWENWVRKNGKPKHKRTGVLYGISLRTENVHLVEAISQIYDGEFKLTLKNRYTFVIEPLG